VGIINAAKVGMKALPKKLLPLILFGIAVMSLFSAQPAQAYIVTLEQVGSNVAVNGSGPINLTGLTFNFIATTTPGVAAFAGQIQTGPFSGPPLDFYSGFTGPASFGSGLGFVASGGSGDLSEFLLLPGFWRCHRAMSPVVL